MKPRGGRRLLAGATLLVALVCASVVPAGAAPPRTAAAATAGCGATILKANGTPWVCMLADNFDGTSLNRALWVPQTSAASGFGSQDDCYVDDRDNIAVSGGALRLSVRKESAASTARCA